MAVASIVGGGTPGDTLHGVTPDLKLIFLWLNLKVTLNKRRGKIDGSGEETTAK